MLESIDSFFMNMSSFALTPLLSFHVLQIVLFLSFIIAVHKDWSEEFSFLLLILTISFTVYNIVLIVKSGHLFITALIVTMYPYIVFFSLYKYITWRSKVNDGNV